MATGMNRFLIHVHNLASASIIHPYAELCWEATQTVLKWYPAKFAASVLHGLFSQLHINNIFAIVSLCDPIGCAFGNTSSKVRIAFGPCLGKILEAKMSFGAVWRRHLWLALWIFVASLLPPIHPFSSVGSRPAAAQDVVTVAAISAALSAALDQFKAAISQAGDELRGLGNSLQANAQNVLQDNEQHPKRSHEPSS
jgi:hypothetical protein